MIPEDMIRLGDMLVLTIDEDDVHYQDLQWAGAEETDEVSAG